MNKGLQLFELFDQSASSFFLFFLSFDLADLSLSFTFTPIHHSRGFVQSLSGFFSF